jgi:hypothetical protein
MAWPGVHETAPETQSARAASRRAQFQLWIFSYTILVGSSKKRVSRVMIGRSRLDIIGRPLMKSRRSDQARLVSAMPLIAARKRRSREVRVGPEPDIGADIANLSRSAQEWASRRSSFICEPKSLRDLYERAVWAQVMHVAGNRGASHVLDRGLWQQPLQAALADVT